MKKQISGLLYFFTTDFRHSFTIFWSILTIITVVSIIASYLLLRIDGSMYLSIAVSVYIYGGILGFLTVKESLPFSLKMGATRRNYFVSIGMLFLLISGLTAILETLLHIIVVTINKVVGIDNFHLLHPASFINHADSWFYRFSIDICLMFFLLTSMFVLGLIFHRYGQIGGIGTVGLLTIVLFILAGTGKLGEFIMKVVSNISYSYFGIVFLIGIVFYFLSWLFIHNVAVKSARSA